MEMVVSRCLVKSPRGVRRPSLLSGLLTMLMGQSSNTYGGWIVIFFDGFKATTVGVDGALLQAW